MLRNITLWATLLCALSANATEKNNVLLICVDDLRPELNCFGVDYIHSPNIDRLALYLHLRHPSEAFTPFALLHTLKQQAR